ncbi:MAG: hypothetical protein QOF21_3280 [Actinomycetota bacterium]|jgi:hypothetical protein
MALPLKTTADDVRRVIGYFKTKPTGATVAEAKSAISSALLDGRKLSGYRQWNVLVRDGDRYRLSEPAWEVARRPETEEAFFRSVIDAVGPYRSAAEWIFHQKFHDLSAIDVAAHWHEHHLAALGADAKDATIRENAISFFHLCEAAGFGKLVLGRGGHPTRLMVELGVLQAHIEAGPSAPPWTGQEHELTDDDDEQAGESLIDDILTPELVVPPPAPEPAAALRVFIAHGKNMEIVEQVETMLGLADIEAEVAEAEETTAIPVPEKVFDAMRRCSAGIIVVNAEQRASDDQPYGINENVLIEIGAAFVLYDKRVVLVWDSRVPVPSNLQGLYRCEYEGDDLSWSTGMKLMKAIQQFKK